MAVGDGFRVKVGYRFGSEETMNVLHMIETEANTDELPAQAVADVIHTAWAATVMQDLSDDVHVPYIHVYPIYPFKGIPVTLVPGGPEYSELVGAELGEPLPSQVAALMKLQTLTIGRRGHGRVYIPGYPEGASNAGRWVLVQHTPVQVSLKNMFENEHTPAVGFTGRFRFAVYSRADEQIRPVAHSYLHSSFATIRGRRQHPGFA